MLLTPKVPESNSLCFEKECILSAADRPEQPWSPSAILPGSVLKEKVFTAQAGQLHKNSEFQVANQSANTPIQVQTRAPTPTLLPKRKLKSFDTKDNTTGAAATDTLGSAQSVVHRNGRVSTFEASEGEGSTSNCKHGRELKEVFGTSNALEPEGGSPEAALDDDNAI